MISWPGVLSSALGFLAALYLWTILGIAWNLLLAVFVDKSIGQRRSKLTQSAADLARKGSKS